MPKKSLSEKPITIASVKKILEERGETELDQFQHRTLDFVQKFAKLDANKAEELVGKLTEKFGVDTKESVQIVNCMPKSVEELRIFFAVGKRRIIATAQLEDILKLLDEYRK
ncbi:MAG TPA: RNA polymerase Rpb4 family protein [archaeon]|nr:RNA polymerase Rpb4 family protein [archaeon]